MAPEMFTGTDAASPAGDVYALGIVIHQLLTGRPPFPGPDLHDLHHQHTDQPPPPLSRSTLALTPALSAALDAVLARALDKDPHRRHHSAGTLAAALSDAVATTEAPEAAGPTRTTATAGTGVKSAPAATSTHQAEPGPAHQPAAYDDSLEAVFLTHPPEPQTRHWAHNSTPQAA